jgi:molecular chaperone GrpE
MTIQKADMDREEQQKTREPDSKAPEFQVIDKRQFLDPEKMDTKLEEEKPRYPSFVEELMARTAAMEKKFEEKKKQMDQEIERTRARLEADLERRLTLDTQKIVLPFLEILDNLQRAIDAATRAGSVDHLKEGVQMTADLFRSKLQAIGVDAIESLNRPFDPNVAQAVGRIEVSDAALDGMVVEELQSGYTMKGQLLRPAKVRVGHHG